MADAKASALINEITALREEAKSLKLLMGQEPPNANQLKLVRGSVAYFISRVIVFETFADFSGLKHLLHKSTSCMPPALRRRKHRFQVFQVPYANSQLYR